MEIKSPFNRQKGSRAPDAGAQPEELPALADHLVFGLLDEALAPVNRTKV